MNTADEMDEIVRELHDRMQIEQVICAYAAGVDRGDATFVNSCFTDDVSIELDDGAISVAGDEARGFYRESLARKPARGMSHVMANILLSVDGDQAHADTTALAFLDLGDPAVVVVRGLDYHDDLVRVAGSWLIRRRVHRSRWQFEASASQASLAASLASGERRRTDTAKPPMRGMPT